VTDSLPSCWIVEFHCFPLQFSFSSSGAEAEAETTKMEEDVEEAEKSEEAEAIFHAASRSIDPVACIRNH